LEIHLPAVTVEVTGDLVVNASVGVLTTEQSTKKLCISRRDIWKILSDKLESARESSERLEMRGDGGAGCGSPLNVCNYKNGVLRSYNWTIKRMPFL
jgi:hypothetical protein